MRGVFNLPTTLFAVIIVVMMFIFIWFSFYNASVLNSELVKASFDKLSAIDATHSVEACISRSSAEGIRDKINQCKQELEISYIEVSDIETGNRVSTGTANSNRKDHAIYIAIKEGDQTHEARLYVQR